VSQPTTRGCGRRRCSARGLTLTTGRITRDGSSNTPERSAQSRRPDFRPHLRSGVEHSDDFDRSTGHDVSGRAVLIGWLDRVRAVDDVRLRSPSTEEISALSGARKNSAPVFAPRYHQGNGSARRCLNIVGICLVR